MSYVTCKARGRINNETKNNIITMHASSPLSFIAPPFYDTHSPRNAPYFLLSLRHNGITIERHIELGPE